MIERVSEDIKAAMKAKDKGRLDALRLLKSAFIENNTSAKPKSDAEVAIAHVKKLKDSMESYPAGSEEVAKIKSEIEFLSAYVPQPLSKEDFETMVRTFIHDNPGADFGAVMKAISPEIKGRFDGREASQIVKTLVG
ncbi:MAG: GatB/YqeY domain-containing protein [Pseudobdellovibrionaceae bacterium]|uniref:GatB/YqeY domain-containing protein n=1 Tax=Oligoflexus sp. TaxID=1971216 RepID=UPI0027BBEA7B|nr:GatB/YqeY domain-containing protein [Oligoflexus sp.]MDQ3234562.1 GatB/YqeY domain-containing protein [Pseudobdellovibrionaceae bacterium]HYX33927.1 GatB/YqeY domain-containing protein [Oligoflexus sp.]